MEASRNAAIAVVERSATGTSQAPPSSAQPTAVSATWLLCSPRRPASGATTIQTSAPTEKSAPMPLGERPFSLRRSDPSRLPMPPTKPSSTVASIA